MGYGRSKRFLTFAEREEIALCNAEGLGVRAIAKLLRRSPSTSSRELRRAPRHPHNVRRVSDCLCTESSMRGHDDDHDR
ncbi:helix-turn-helix domain-containing protein [Auritidibacter sp. NML100628]|uniref:helix-turn-helix domain-containing protein n=1 Tax=Auritidibacter sp. NML100628 TaxID=2170742 RepID=UPI003513798B